MASRTLREFSQRTTFDGTLNNEKVEFTLKNAIGKKSLEAYSKSGGTKQIEPDSIEFSDVMKQLNKIDFSAPCEKPKK